mgnify:CR=1 FL=1
MKIVPRNKSTEFEQWLCSIGGLINEYDNSIIMKRSYFSVGDGWLQIVKECIENLIKEGWDKRVEQVKEKFGDLRFYIANNYAIYGDIIQKSMIKASNTCELCGKHGRNQLVRKMLLQVICEECLDKKQNKEEQ